MKYHGIDELMKTTNSIFKLSILAAKRAQELSQGQPKLIECVVGEKPTTISLQEIIDGKITYKISDDAKK